MQKAMIEKARQLMADDTVSRVIGWKKGDFAYDSTPAVFKSIEDIESNFVYDDFTASNVSKYLIKESQNITGTLVFLKPCDSYSFNQLLKEHRIVRDNIHVVGVECNGKLDIEKIKNRGIEGVQSIENNDGTLLVKTIYGEETVLASEVMAERCLTCKSKKHVVYDELLGENGEVTDANRFAEVEKLENMTAEERYDFWRGQLSKCIRCNACRNICPACSCEKCVFDNDNSGVANKAPADSFEENMFHIIRAFHVAGRCTDCGECTRVCPQNIPLHLLNRKYIKDINELYGEYQAGEDAESTAPLTNYTQEDCEPSVVHERGVE